MLVERQSNSAIPSPNLADALVASRKASSATLNLGSLRKALPERKPNNALYFEGVLGYDEEMLQDLLRPHMKGLKFSLTWVVSRSARFSLTRLATRLTCSSSSSSSWIRDDQTDEDVLASFESFAGPSTELEPKIASISSNLRTAISDTGFCYSVEPVVLSEDGRVIRGSWTPVASGSRSTSEKKSLATPLKTANAFAAFGGGGAHGSAATEQQQQQNVWGSLVGLAHNKVSCQPQGCVLIWAKELIRIRTSASPRCRRSVCRTRSASNLVAIVVGVDDDDDRASSRFRCLAAAAAASRFE